MNKNFYRWLAIGLLPLILMNLFAGETTKKGADAPPVLRKGGRRGIRESRSSKWMWQVFSRLSHEERKEMEKLQREEPDKFREIMTAKAKDLRLKRQARIAELEALAKECRNAASGEAFEAARKKLAAEVEKDFRERLAANRRHLEEMKRRTVRMENELNRREEHCTEAVDAMVKAMISGKKGPGRRHDGRFRRP